MQRWQQYSQDPNAPEVLARRREAIQQVRSALQIPDRVQYLCSLATGRKVLDIGVVEHTSLASGSPLWLHGNLKRCAAQCVGVDVLSAEVQRLCAEGYDVRCADVTIAPLADTFDVIIAGEVLEHLDAPGRFMANCASMLRPTGRLVITVPNPWHLNVILKNLRQSTTFVDSADHVAWYESSVLYELGQRHGLELERSTGIGGHWAKSWHARMIFNLAPWWIRLGFSPELFSKSIIHEFVRI